MRSLVLLLSILFLPCFFFLAGCDDTGITEDPLAEEDPGNPAGSVSIREVDSLPADFGSEGVDYWVAKVRYGDAKAIHGQYELELGRGHVFHHERDTRDITWGNGEANTFTFAFEADGTAALTVVSGGSGEEGSVSWDVGSAAGDMYVYFGIPNDCTVSFSDLMVNDLVVDPGDFSLSGSDTGITAFYCIETGELDLNSGFTITGSFVFSWTEGVTETRLERPNVVFKVPFSD